MAGASNEDSFSIELKDGIIVIDCFPGVFDLERIKCIVDKRMEVHNGIERPVIIKFNGSTKFDSAAKKFMRSEESMQYMKAVGFVIDSKVMRIILNALIRFTSPSFHSACFASMDDARNWLQKFK